MITSDRLDLNRTPNRYGDDSRVFLFLMTVNRIPDRPFREQRQVNTVVYVRPLIEEPYHPFHRNSN